MCGVIGCVGFSDAVSVVMIGLRAMEYRGYDSAGFAAVTDEGITVLKAVGKLGALEAMRASIPSFSSSLAIGHTRWATHGGVSETNAHPHGDCRQRIFVAHNGIIENYILLRDELRERGHQFRSETDTEVLPHLIEEALRSGEISFPEAVRQALLRVEGAYGLVAIAEDYPEMLVTARQSSSVLLGISLFGQMVASDSAAIFKHTTNVVDLDNGEIAVLTPDRYDIFTLAQQMRIKPLRTLELSSSEIEKGPYGSFMEKEIWEQPEAVVNVMRGRIVPDRATVQLGGLRDYEHVLRAAAHVTLVGCGSAYLAACVGRHMIQHYAGISASAEIASEFSYGKQIFREGDVCFFISQSGETEDTRIALREVKARNVPAFGIVNVVASPLARETDAGVYMHVGLERSVAATKTFVGQMAVLALLALFLGRQRGLSYMEAERIIADMQAIPEKMRRILELSEAIKAIANRYLGCKRFLYLGRNFLLPVAMEGALKIKEIAYVAAEGLGAGEMKHGPLALVDEETPTVCLALTDSLYKKTEASIEEIKTRRGPVIAIATEGNQEIANVTDNVIFIPQIHEMLSPLLAVIPLQLFAYHFGVLRGLDVDMPRNLAKSVTVE